MKKTLNYIFLLNLICGYCYGGILSLTLENDATSHSDNNYTHGTELKWKSGEDLSKVFHYFKLPEKDKPKNTFIIKLNQLMYTPDDLSIEEYIPDNRPYAGLLFLNIGLSEYDEKKYDYIEYGIGFLGENSFAKETQTAIHKLIDSREPKGWDNQIEKGLVFSIKYEHKRNLVQNETYNLIPTAGMTVGNVWNNLHVGFEPRIGFNLPENYDDNIITPTKADTLITDTLSDLSVYLYGISKAQYVIYNSTLKGVKEEDYIFDYGAGAKLIYKDFGINFTHIWRSKEFTTGYEKSYSSLSLEYKL